MKYHTDYINKLSIKDGEKLITEVLKGKSTFPLNGGMGEQPIEVILSDIIKDSLTLASRRSMIFEICRKSLLYFIQTSREREFIRNKDIYIKILSVIELTTPIQLRVLTRKCLETAVSNEDIINKDIMIAAASAYLSYTPQDFGEKGDLKLWRRAIKRSYISSYALIGLARLEKDDILIRNYLITLWSHQINDGWNLDISYLIKRVKQIRGKVKI